MKHFSLLSVFIFMIVVTIGPLAAAQQPASLRITLPANETPVTPGQILQVMVQTSGMNKVAVLGTEPIVASDLKSAASELTFTLTIPAVITPGRYFLTASGISLGGSPIDSTSVSIIVHSNELSPIQINPSQLMLLAPGNQAIITVESKGAAENVKIFNEDVAFTSTDPQIASVDENGIVTAVAAGTTKISATYRTGATPTSASSTVTVGGALRGDLNNDGKVNIDDLHLLQSFLNTPAIGPNDARDLNHDGKIDALDERILVTLCTHPGCTYK